MRHTFSKNLLKTLGNKYTVELVLIMLATSKLNLKSLHCIARNSTTVSIVFDILIFYEKKWFLDDPSVPWYKLSYSGVFAAN